MVDTVPNSLELRIAKLSFIALLSGMSFDQNEQDFSSVHPEARMHKEQKVARVESAGPQGSLHSSSKEFLSADFLSRKTLHTPLNQDIFLDICQLWGYPDLVLRATP